MTAFLRNARRHALAILFFAVLLLTGVLIYRDYGLSWDEPAQRYIGFTNVGYMLGHDMSLLEIKDRFYGPTYEIFLIVVEKLFNPATSREMIFLRHLFTFLTFFAGAVCFYILAKNITQRTSTALLSAIALVLSPRIFDNAFYNSKDIPLLVFFIISFMLLFLYMDTRKTWLLALLAIFAALTMTIRVAGILIPVLAGVAIIAKPLQAPASAKEKLLAILPPLALLLTLFTAFTILLWPILWSNPIGNFLQAMREMSQFQWWGSVLFMGNVYNGSDNPALYPVVWIFISTPIVYCLLFLAGSGFLLGENIRAPRAFFSSARLKLLFIAAWFFAPLLLVIVLKATLYNSWRHLFFIYPAFLLLAFWGLERIVAWLNARFRGSKLPAAAVYAALLLSFASTGLFMVRAHPYQQVYFNRLAGDDLREIRNLYDMDYWGLSYRAALEYLAQHDPDRAITYVTETRPGQFTFILPPADQKRMFPVEDASEADYLITNYRYTKDYPPYEEVFSVQVEGAKLLSVFKLR